LLGKEETAWDLETELEGLKEAVIEENMKEQIMQRKEATQEGQEEDERRRR
jgi:hypothetical protein